MLKRISCLALILVFLLGLFALQVAAIEDVKDLEQQTVISESADSFDSAVAETETIDEQADNSNGPCVLLDGVVIQDAAAFLHESITYVSLRAVTMALRPDAVITWGNGHAEITAEGLSMTVYPNCMYIQANGRYLHVPKGVLLINGSVMLPVRVLAQALGAEIQWDPDTRNTHIINGTGAIVSGDEFYNADSLYWLSRVIHAESGNQPLSGKIGVGNVILNRMKNPVFPSTIYGVIFQANQFSPVSNGSIYKEPNKESVIAAKLCLDGAVILPDALWFNRAGINCWASRNKSCVATIGDHDFYA